jgi:hypothetical protein
LPSSSDHSLIDFLVVGEGYFSIIRNKRILAPPIARARAHAAPKLITTTNFVFYELLLFLIFFRGCVCV